MDWMHSLGRAWRRWTGGPAAGGVALPVAQTAPADAPELPAGYAAWIREVEQARLPSPEAQRERSASWAWQPRFALLLAVQDDNPRQLQACVDSVLAQHYPHWLLCVADDGSGQASVRQLLAELARRDPRVRVLRREVPGRGARACNSALALAQGDFAAVLPANSQLAPQALFIAAQALQAAPDTQVLYSDEDRLDPTGRRCEPVFKAAWSPELLHGQDHLSRLGLFRLALVRAVGGFRPAVEGQHVHDLALRCAAHCSRPGEVLHLPHVLLHQGLVSPAGTEDAQATRAASAATATQRQALQDHLDSCHPGARASVVAPGLTRTHWPLPEQLPPVSLIIQPGLDAAALQRCVHSLRERTRYPDLEILVLPGLHEPAALQALLVAGAAQVLATDVALNPAAAVNLAARQARGQLLGLLHPTVRVIDPDWLLEMVAHALRPDVGCVGAKLYRADDRVLHAGLVLGMGGVAGQPHRGAEGGAAGQANRLRVLGQVSAVSSAALLLRKALFLQVDGLDAQGLPQAYNDLDLCLKLGQAGYRHLWTPFAELYAEAPPVPAMADWASARQCLRARWGAALAADRFYSPHLSLREECVALRAAADYPADDLAGNGLTGACAPSATLATRRTATRAEATEAASL